MVSIMIVYIECREIGRAIIERHGPDGTAMAERCPDYSEQGPGCGSTAPVEAAERCAMVPSPVGSRRSNSNGDGMGPCPPKSDHLSGRELATLAPRSTGGIGGVGRPLFDLALASAKAAKLCLPSGKWANFPAFGKLTHLKVTSPLASSIFARSCLPRRPTRMQPFSRWRAPFSRIAGRRRRRRVAGHPD